MQEDNILSRASLSDVGIQRLTIDASPIEKQGPYDWYCMAGRQCFSGLSTWHMNGVYSEKLKSLSGLAVVVEAIN